MLNYVFFPSCQVAADPKIIYGTLKIATYFTIAFGCGYLWRIGGHHPSQLFFITKILATLCTALMMGYITIANFLGIGGTNEIFWTKEKYNSDKTLFYTQKMYLSPFPARVIGVRYYNRHGRFVGGSSEPFSTYKLNDMRLGEIPDGSADILLHKKYKSKVDEILADCKEGFRKVSGRTTVYLFNKNDSLRRIEADYYENGIISKIRNYKSISGNEYEIVRTFDELGTPLRLMYNNNDFLRLWHIHDFRIEDKVPPFNYGYDNPDNPKLDEHLRKILDYNTLFESVRDSLKAAGQVGDNLSVALQLQGFTNDENTSISVAIDADSYYGTGYNTNFKRMESVEEMNAICDALTLCRLESAITERIVNYTDDYIKCPRIRIRENSKRNKYMILYILEDRAISSDFKLRFVFSPSIHADKKKRKDATILWQKMQQIIKKQ